MMKLQASPNKYSCVAAAFAMVLELPVRKIFGILRHDGSEMVFKNGQSAGFNPHECIIILAAYGYTCTPFEVNIISTNADNESYLVTMGLTEDQRRQRVLNIMKGKRGVVIGINHVGNGHAMAWNGSYFFDPAGLMGSAFSGEDLETSGFRVDCFWWITPAN
jgi:hypothetical protein